MKRLKDKEIKEYKITISTIREHWKDGNSYTWFPRVWCAKIEEPTVNTYFCDDTEEKLFEKIKHELYINKPKKSIWNKIKDWFK